MADPTGETASALEQFRQEWKNEVEARARHAGQGSQNQHEHTRSTAGKARRTSEVRLERPVHKPPTRHPAADIQDELDEQHREADTQRRDSGGAANTNASTSMIQRIEGLSLRHVDDDEFSIKRPTTEPKSALEHYERAVERESQGKLGDSISHYRKAYRLDAKVDQSYRNKHFPAKSKPTNQLNPSNAPATVPNPAHHSSKDPPTETLSTLQLIQSFANAPIQGAPPMIEGDIPPPCAINRLPAEVLLELLQHVGIRDPALMMRLALVCKKLAYMVYTDNGMWKRIALGPEFGLAGQQYQFATDLQGREAIYQVLEDDEDEYDPALSIVTESNFPSDTVWRDVFHSYPRIRFTGVYISTVNYSRPGGASATPNTWSNPVHIVTYYRYLRFFRDGTCISLLTTNEPIEVVHHLTKENLSFVRSSGKKDASHLTSSATTLTRERESATHHGNTATSGTSATSHAPPPSAQQIMKHALRGRWRLCHPSLETPTEATDLADQGAASIAGATALRADALSLSSPSPIISPGDLHIETEGAGPRYMYTMHLSLKSAGPVRSRHTTKNNKLVWKGFWSYNVLTSDWAEFHLKNDKPFFFSRVRGYGLGY
ncbi:hypothetical protein PV10_06243 [Exophiala mesophila]|uniref:F-box domain-containing protein n=1 Tax=Exophiala mesophila TaxID=212818 RepID=A0A0D1ZCQ4_EXOME|nr:uncharacterized protein PV10_06243 [Exophiala mesophila]KIV91734.1 hypothetical protein PV10_06243 [Exophiala mesophila]